MGHAYWMWYPGQRAAAIHADLMRRSMARCRNVGYSGHFPQVSPVAYFRFRGRLEKAETIRWNAPAGRVRLRCNGWDGAITSRQQEIPAGAVEILISVDFVNTLACVHVEGERLGSGEGWEASLDLEHWVAAEYEPAIDDALAEPPFYQERIQEIAPARVSRRGPGDVVVAFAGLEIGKVVFDAAGDGPATVAVGESEGEVLGPQEQREQTDAVVRAGEHAEAPERAVWYARVSVPEGGRVENVRLLAPMTTLRQRGRFACSDPLLNRTYDVAVDTVRTCTHGVLLDGVKRDGLPWALDALQLVEAADCLYFDAGLCRTTLLTQTVPLGRTLEHSWIYDFPLYTALMFGHELTVRESGAWLRVHQERLWHILELYLGALAEDGLLHGGEQHAFLPDWSVGGNGPDCTGAPAYAQMLLARALSVGAAVANTVGDLERAQRYQRQAARMLQTVLERFWDGARQVMRNGVCKDGQVDGRVSHFAQTFAVLFGVVGQDNHAGLVRHGLEANHPRRNYSLNYYFELQAYAKAGAVQAMLGHLREIWGGQLKRGYVRFIEDIRPGDSDAEQLAFYGRPFANSLCHGWAGAAPVTALVRGVLGVSPIAPRRYRVWPELGGLEWAEGVVPTAAGDLAVRIDGTGVRVEVPAGMTIEHAQGTSVGPCVATWRG